MRFSTRTRWDRGLSAFGEAWAAAESGLRHDLTISNPMKVGLPYPTAALQEALGSAAAEVYTADAMGLPCARFALAGWGEKRGWKAKAEQILLTASTSEAYSFLFKLLAEPGDRILSPTPSYPLFEYLGDLSDVVIDPYPLQEADGWSIDQRALEAAISDKTKAIIVVSPNNPTGSCLHASDLAYLRSICKAFSLPLIVDEVFAEYRFSSQDSASPELPCLDDLNDILWFSMGGLSKTAGLPGMKLAWTVVGGLPEARAEALGRLEVIADTFLSPSMPVQAALPRLLEIACDIRGLIFERVTSNLRALRRLLQGQAISCLPVEGGWSAILRVPATRSDEAWALAALQEAGVLVFPGSLFHFARPGSLVISLLPRPDLFCEGIAALLRLL